MRDREKPKRFLPRRILEKQSEAGVDYAPTSSYAAIFLLEVALCALGFGAPFAGEFTGVGCLAFFAAAFFVGCGGTNTVSTLVRKSNSPSRGMPTCPASARRKAKRVSLSSAVASMVECSTSSALRCSFSLSAAMFSWKSSAKV